MNDITEELEKIKERNSRVEIDKAWETSWTRRISIMVLTYIIASVWLWVIGEEYVFLKSVVPTLGYLLSTLSIPQIRKVWMNNR
jgi:preprotein translocase subunit SecF